MPIKGIEFKIGSEGTFDKSMESTAISVLTKAAKKKRVTTWSALAEGAGIELNRLCRIIDALGIRPKLSKILDSNKPRK